MIFINISIAHATLIKTVIFFLIIIHQKRHQCFSCGIDKSIQNISIVFKAIKLNASNTSDFKMATDYL